MLKIHFILLIYLKRNGKSCRTCGLLPPNGGEDQPGCGLEFGSCSHGRAPEMYLKSIALPPNSSDCHFRSNPCKSYDKFQKGKCNSCFVTDLDECGIMGYHSDKSKGVGNQYLLTKNKKPFCTNNQP